MSAASGALLALLDALRGRVAELVERRGSGDPTAADPLRGLYVTQEHAHRLATAAPQPAAGLMGSGELGGSLGELAGPFGLSPLDQRILLAACAPDVDRRFEPLYGYLNDDVGRRRATVALALDLAGTAPHDPAARARFHPLAPLRAGGRFALEDEDRPLPGRALRVPERVVARLLGDDALLDTELVGRGVELLPPAARDVSAPGDPLATRLAGLAADRALLVHLREHRDGSPEPGGGRAAGHRAARAAPPADSRAGGRHRPDRPRPAA